MVKHNLTNSWMARFIRFVATERIGRKALRVEVYGVLTPPGDHDFINIYETRILVFRFS